MINKELRVPNYLTEPMPLMKQWRLCDEDGYLEGNILFDMREFIVRWTADGYCVEFHYLVVAESLDNAKELWDEYIKTHEKIQYSWDKAVKAVKHHYGGYISWKDNGDTNRSKGCYEMESENIFTGSDHLRD